MRKARLSLLFSAICLRYSSALRSPSSLRARLFCSSCIFAAARCSSSSLCLLPSALRKARLILLRLASPSNFSLSALDASARSSLRAASSSMASSRISSEFPLLSAQMLALTAADLLLLQSSAFFVLCWCSLCTWLLNSTSLSTSAKLVIRSIRSLCDLALASLAARSLCMSRASLRTLSASDWKERASLLILARSALRAAASSARRAWWAILASLDLEIWGLTLVVVVGAAADPAARAPRGGRGPPALACLGGPLGLAPTATATEAGIRSRS